MRSVHAVDGRVARQGFQSLFVPSLFSLFQAEAVGLRFVAVAVHELSLSYVHRHEIGAAGYRESADDGPPAVPDDGDFPHPELAREIFEHELDVVDECRNGKFLRADRGGVTLARTALIPAHEGVFLRKGGMVPHYLMAVAHSRSPVQKEHHGQTFFRGAYADVLHVAVDFDVFAVIEYVLFHIKAPS